MDEIEPTVNEPDLLLAALQERTLKGLAHDELDNLLSSECEAYRLLESENPDIRLAALSVLSEQFNSCDDARVETLESVVAYDGDRNVKMSATLILARCFLKRRENNNCKRLLVRTIKDIKEPESARIFCYNFLLGLCDCEKSLIETVSEIEWHFVSQVEHSSGM